MQLAPGYYAIGILEPVFIFARFRVLPNGEVDRAHPDRAVIQFMLSSGESSLSELEPPQRYFVAPIPHVG